MCNPLEHRKFLSEQRLKEAILANVTRVIDPSFWSRLFPTELPCTLQGGPNRAWEQPNLPHLREFVARHHRSVLHHEFENNAGHDALSELLQAAESVQDCGSSVVYWYQMILNEL